MNSFADTFKYVFGQFRGFADILDIILVAVLIFFVINFIRSRRASRVAVGILLVIAVIFIFSLFDLRAINFLFSNILQVGIIALIIIFQPEIRSAFEKIGSAPLSKFLGDQSSQASKHEMISNICSAACELSQEYTGALIVIERSTQLGDIIRTGTLINADVEVALIKNIFYNKAPLHDGAMIIKSDRICAAGCILPLSTKDDIIKDLGTRHRSAIGMSENSDAVVIVVSEETGTISIAVDGQLKRNYDYNTLRNELSYLLRDNADKKSKNGRG